MVTDPSKASQEQALAQAYTFMFNGAKKTFILLFKKIF